MTNALYLRADLTLRKRRSLESSLIAKGVPITTTATFSTSEPIQAGNALSLYSPVLEQCPPPHDSDACVAESLKNLTDNIYTHHHHRASLYDKIDERFYSYDHRQLIHLAPESWHQPIITRYSGEVATRGEWRSEVYETGG